MNKAQLINYAVKNNAYYKDLFALNNLSIIKEDLFDKIPTSDKKSFQRYGDMLSLPYQSYPLSENIVTINSSGSTGECLKIYWDKKDRVFSLLTSWKWRKKHFGISPSDKFIDFYTTHYINNRFVEDMPDILEIGKHHTSFSKLNLTPEKLDKYIDYLYCFQPVWINVTPSILTLLTMRLEERELKFPATMKYIELNGEYISKESVAYFSKRYGVYIANFYGCNEVNYIACECECGNMHVLEENVFLEILKDGKTAPKGEQGDIVVSGLHNKAMPAIRYKPGDEGMLDSVTRCPCGEKSPILTLSEIRNKYVIKTRNSSFSSTEIIYLIERVNSLLNHCILQYQAIQRETDEIEMHVVLKKDYETWKDTVKETFEQNIVNEELKEIEWNFYFEDAIYPAPTTGKLSYFIGMM